MNEKATDAGELISALVDGELTAAELGQAVDSASRDPQGLATWRSYHVVGDALRGASAASPTEGGRFLERLRGRLADEVPERPAGAAADFAPTALPARPASANDAVLRWKLLAGAASLAAVSMLGWHVASQQAPAGVLAALPVPAQTSDSVIAPAAPAVVLRDARLDALMVAHKQYGGTSALQMPAGFLRNATFDGSGR